MPIPRFTFVPLLVGVLFSSDLLAEQAPATQPAAPARETKPRAARPKLPHLGKMPMEKIADLRLEEGNLILSTGLPRTPERSKVEVEGWPGFATVQIMGEVEEGTPARHFDFQHHSFARPGTMSVMTQVQGTLISLQITQSVERVGGFQSVQLIQSNRMPAHVATEGENGVSLYVQGFDTFREDETLDLNLWAPNLAELRRRHPKAAARFVQPIFRDLGQPDLFAIEPAVAWQVFSEEFQPDPKLKEQVERLVTQFDAESFAEREKAFEDLKQMGQSASAVLAQMDRSALSGEQAARLDTILADHQQISPQQAEKLRGDNAFLLDCLYCADEQIRRLALEQLGDNLGRRIDLDVAGLGTPQYHKSVEQLRAELFPPPTPATRPS